MLALIFGVLFAVSFLGFAITSRTKYSAASHLFWEQCVMGDALLHSDKSYK